MLRPKGLQKRIGLNSMDRQALLRRVTKKLKEKLPGGRGDGLPDSDFDADQLAKGIDIEMEHTNDPDIAKEIAKDHLIETQKYYITEKGESRLDIMEQEAEDEYEREITKKK
jgi:hypothetical protein